MSRIPSRSLVKGLDLSNPSSIITILEYTRDKGIVKIGFLLETCALEVLLGGKEYTLVFSEPALIVFPSDENKQLEGFYQVAKSAWCNHVLLNTQDLLLTLRNYINRVNYALRDVKIIFHKDSIDCMHLYLLDTLLLKNSWRPIINQINYEKIKELLSKDTKSNKHTLLVCLDNEPTPVVWVEKVGNADTLNIIRVDEKVEAIVLKTYLDYIVSILSSNTPETIHSDH
ncbi:MAG: hypothetical protein QXE81_00020 [Desulfurococcaceae archaeon]